MLATILVSSLMLLQVVNLTSLESIGIPFWLTEQIPPFSESDWQTRLIFGGICFGVFLLGVGLLYIALRPLFPREPRFLISQDELGKVEISESCIEKFINHQARLFREISDARSQIINKKDGLHIKSYIVVTPETKISELGRNLQNRLKNKLESNLGLLTSNIIIIAKINRPANQSKKVLK